MELMSKKWYFTWYDLYSAEVQIDNIHFINPGTSTATITVNIAGSPVDLGATGSTPTGTAPRVFCHLDPGEEGDAFITNRAGNGDLTETGDITTEAGPS